MQWPAGDRTSLRHGGRSRQIALWTLFFVTAYLVFLAATMPARMVGRVVGLPPQVVHLAGTVWKGESVFTDGVVVTWRVDPLRSLLALALEAEWTLQSPDTRLSGLVQVSPNAFAVSRITGVAGWSLVEAALPQVPFTCEPRARVEIDRVSHAAGVIDAAGTLTTAEGICGDAIADVLVPALAGEIVPESDGVRLTVSMREPPGTVLGEARITQTGVLELTIQPAGAALVPGMPSSAATMIEIPLAFKAQPLPSR